MKDIIYIGSTPCEEPCAQVGTEGYAERALAECERFRKQLRAQFGPEPEGARLKIKANPHDFGTYYDVQCEVEDTNEQAMEYALRCEGEAWGEWRDAEEDEADGEDPGA